MLVASSRVRRTMCETFFSSITTLQEPVNKAYACIVKHKKITFLDFLRPMSAASFLIIIDLYKIITMYFLHAAAVNFDIILWV